mgnify:CR=1 FL=1
MARRDPLLSKGLFVGIAFVLFLGILVYKAGENFIRPSSSLPSPQPLWQEVIEDKILSPAPGITDPLITTVETFYTYIANQQFDLAYDLLSDTFHNEVDYNQFAKGYATTVKTTLAEAKRIDKMKNVVQVKIIASDSVENKSLTRTFIGEWQLVEEKGVWKLDAANIQQIE